MSNIKFSARSYMQPTPSTFRRLGDGLLAVGTFITGAAIAEDKKWVAYLALGISVFAKFLTNFFQKP